MSVFTALSFVFLAFFSPIALVSALPEALPCPTCVDETFVIEPCDECEHMHMPPPVIVTKTEDCEECEHNHPATKPWVFTSTISTCRRETTKSYTPYTSGSSTFFLSSCKPTTLTTTQHGTCENGPTSTITIPGSVSVSTTTFFGNGSAITIYGTSTITSTSYRNNSAPGFTTTVIQPGKTTTVAGSPTGYITVTKGRRTITSLTTATLTIAGNNVTCNAVTQTLITKKTATRSKPANTVSVASGGEVTVTITTEYPSCDHNTRTVQQTITTTEYGATAPSQVTVTRVRRAVTVTTTMPGSTVVTTETATATAVGPVQYSTVPTTEYATFTSYASGSPPATIYITRTRTTTNTVTAAPNTVTITENHTSDVYAATLPASTRTTTVQLAARTVTATITATLPASTSITTVQQAARTVTNTITATSEGVTIVQVTTTLPGSTALRTRTKTITASYITSGTITKTITVTNTLAASTITETTTKTAIRTRTQTTQVVSEQTLTATATATSNVYSTATITKTQVRRVTTTEEQPAGYCTPTTIIRTSTVTNTAISVQTTTRTRTINNGPPAGYTGSWSAETVTQTRTVTENAPCATNAKPTVANCLVPTGSFRVVIQNFGSAYLPSTSGGGKPVGDHQSLTITSAAGQALQFSAVSNGQMSFITVGGKTLYSDQDAANDGNSPVYFDSLGSLSGYSSGSEPVQFCLQSDNTFVVQNPADGATSVMMCAGVINLFTAGNAATSGCTAVTLVKA